MYENNNGPYQPGVPPTYAPVPTTDPTVESYVNAAFTKSLASVIMCEFPVASIIAIVMGSKGLEFVEAAKTLAAQRGVKPSGKNIAANILGKIGKIAGIVMTIFWGVYFLIFLIILANI